jgi:hypothetical protein
LPEDYSAVPSCDGGAYRLLSWSCDFRFLPKLPLTCVTFRLALQTSTTLRTLSVSFPAGRSLLVRALRPDRASSASYHLSSLLTAISSGIRSGSPCGFLFRNLLHGFFTVTWRGVGAISRMTNQSFNQKTSGVLSSPCGRSLAREDFLRKPSGTCEPFNLRPFCYNIQKNTWHLLVVRPVWIAPCWPEPRPICGADLATCSIWLPIQLSSRVAHNAKLLKSRTRQPEG